MPIARRHFPGAVFGWGAAMNLFSLIFALILAVLFTILLLLFVHEVERKQPPVRSEPSHTAEVGCRLPVIGSQFSVVSESSWNLRPPRLED